MIFFFYGLLALSASMALASTNEAIGCYVPGECVNGFFVDVQPNVKNASACLEFCQSVEDCNVFTYYEDKEACFAFRDCPEVSTSCSDCISGDSTCQPRQCSIQGECKGTLVAFIVTYSPEECAAECRNTTGCNWYSFDSSDNFCTLLKECEVLDATCETCLSGEVHCDIDIDPVFTTTTEDPEPICGQDLVGLTGEFSSPNFPDGDYPPNSHCEWTIFAGLGTVIQLDFTDFKIESHQCAFDNVTVYDGIYADSEVLGVYCGTDGLYETVPKSSGNSMRVVFLSDSQIQEKGFRAEWEAEPKE